MAQSAVFINVQVSIDPTDKAAGAAGLFLAVPVGAIIGTASSSAIMLGILRKFAQQKLAELGLPRENIEDVLRKATENVAYIHQAPASISEVLVRGYVKGIEYSHGECLFFYLHRRCHIANQLIRYFNYSFEHCIHHRSVGN